MMTITGDGGSHSFTALIDDADLPDPSVPCRCDGGCDWTGPFEALAPIDKCALNIGEPTPAGRCPNCGALADLVVITDKVSDAPTEPVGERMRRLAAENGAKPVIEWVESVIDYNETHFRWLAGQTTTEDLERAHKRKIAAHTALSPEQRQLPFLKDGGDGPMTGNPEAFRQKVMLEVLRLIENKEIVVGDGASETHVVVRTFEARDYDPTTYLWMASGLPKPPDDYGGAEFDIVTMPRWVARGEAPIDYRYTITITET